MSIEGALEASTKVLAYLDGQLADGHGWLVPGDTPTIADVCVYPYVAFAEQSSKGALSFAPYPALQRWLAKVKALPGFVEFPGI